MQDRDKVGTSQPDLTQEERPKEEHLQQPKTTTAMGGAKINEAIDHGNRTGAATVEGTAAGATGRAVGAALTNGAASRRTIGTPRSKYFGYFG